MNDSQLDSMRTVSWVSYLLHLIVAVGAVFPGAQASLALLLVALIMDLVKKGDADGSWMASHFSFRIRTVLWAGVLYAVTSPLWLLLLAPGWLAWSAASHGNPGLLPRSFPHPRRTPSPSRFPKRLNG